MVFILRNMCSIASWTSFLFNMVWSWFEHVEIFSSSDLNMNLFFSWRYEYKWICLNCNMPFSICRKIYLNFEIEVFSSAFDMKHTTPTSLWDMETSLYISEAQKTIMQESEDKENLTSHFHVITIRQEMNEYTVLGKGNQIDCTQLL